MRRVLGLMAGLLLCQSASAQLPPGLAGTWVWPVEDRNLMVLTLKADAKGEVGLLQHPSQMSVSRAGAGLAVTGVQMPVLRSPVEYLREAGDGHVLRFHRADGSATEFLWRPDGAGGGLLSFGTEPGVPAARFVRPGDPVAIPEDWEPAKSYLARSPSPESSKEMAGIFGADQADRQLGPAIDWKSVAPRDEQRRKRVREMLDQGLLNSGDDYYYAAFVFQHGESPADYLLAHVLAMAAQNRGRPGAAWIGTATLDRYLHSIGQPQLLGTQFQNQAGGQVSQGDYDRALVPDTLRPALDLPTRAEEQALMRRMEEARKRAAETAQAN